MKEIWKDIEKYEGYYQVSNLGKVKSLQRIVVDKKSTRTFKSRVLKPSPDTHGYLQVRPSKKGKVKTFRVHQLVARAFIPNPHNKPEINHDDGNKINNCVSNLEWQTSRENSIHASQTGLLNITHNKPVIQYDLNHKILNKFNSGKMAQDLTGVNRNNISQCSRGNIKTAGGFIWGFL